jgi:fused signal recognition particle receptor
MIYAALLVIFIVCIGALVVGLRTLQSSRRSEGLGEDRNQLLRDQYERLELLREERQALIEELQGETRERRQLMKYLEGGRTQLVDDLEAERQGRIESARSVEQNDQERGRLEQQIHQLQEELEQESRTHLEAQQRAERLEQEHQLLTAELEKERSEGQQRDAQREEERELLLQELRHVQEQLESQKRAPSRNRSQKRETVRPWWHRGILVAGLLVGVLAAWLTSVMVALNMLSS